MYLLVIYNIINIISSCIKISVSQTRKDSQSCFLNISSVCIVFKVPIINIFILTMDQMLMCTVKVLTPRDEPTEIYHSTLQLYGAF